MAAVLPAGDFGDSWSEIAPAETPVLSGGSCSDREGGPEGRLGTGAVHQGPMMQLVGSDLYLFSRAHVFESADDAIAWLEIISSDEWGECVREEIQADQVARDSLAKVRLDSREYESLGEGGFEAYAAFLLEDSETSELLGVFPRYFYRVDRVVILVGNDIGGVTDEEFVTFEDAWYAALLRAYDRVDAIVAEQP